MKKLLVIYTKLLYELKLWTGSCCRHRLLVHNYLRKGYPRLWSDKAVQISIGSDCNNANARSHIFFVNIHFYAFPIPTHARHHRIVLSSFKEMASSLPKCPPVANFFWNLCLVSGLVLLHHNARFLPHHSVLLLDEESKTYFSKSMKCQVYVISKSGQHYHINGNEFCSVGHLSYASTSNKITSPKSFSSIYNRQFISCRHRSTDILAINHIDTLKNLTWIPFVRECRSWMFDLYPKKVVKTAMVFKSKTILKTL